MDMQRWSHLSKKEKKQEFQELTHSSYWCYLPKTTQARVLSWLVSNEKELRSNIFLSTTVSSGYCTEEKLQSPDN